MKKEFIVNINKIKQKYDCKGELVFRSALCLLLDYGKERCGNMDWVNDNKELTKKNHKEAEEQGQHLIIGEKLELAIIDCAYELAQFGNWELMEYIQTEMFTCYKTPTFKDLTDCIVNLCYWISDRQDVKMVIYDELGIDEDIFNYIDNKKFIFEEEE